MKRFIRIVVLAVALFTGLTTVSAQTVQVQMIPKIPVLPSTVISYLDDPLRYFNVQFIVSGAGSEGLYIFLDMDLTVNTSPLYIRTQPDNIPLFPLHVSEGVNRMKSEDLATQVDGRTENNIDFNSLINAQQLPEGTYTLCVDIYLWSDRLNPARESIRIGPCSVFDICYSGSAPELVSPMAGAQPALNGAMVVAPNRKLDFLWTPVISNCAGRSTRFKYKLKVVKVLAGQNYNDAIKFNPTVFSAEVRNDNVAVFDTLRDIKVQMEKVRSMWLRCRQSNSRQEAMTFSLLPTTASASPCLSSGAMTALLNMVRLTIVHRDTTPIWMTRARKARRAKEWTA